MSSRRGISPPPSLMQSAPADRTPTKRSNRYSESCGPGPGLGVVLDGGAGHVEQAQPLDRAVVEVDVRELGLAEVRLPADRLIVVDRARAAGAEHREAVVLAR